VRVCSYERDMSEWMNEMKIDEISPFPISRLSLHFSIPREFLHLIIGIIIYCYPSYHLDSGRRNGSKTEENKNEWNQNVSTVEVERRRRGCRNVKENRRMDSAWGGMGCVQEIR